MLFAWIAAKFKFSRTAILNFKIFCQHFWPFAWHVQLAKAILPRKGFDMLWCDFVTLLQEQVCDEMYGLRLQQSADEAHILNIVLVENFDIFDDDGNGNADGDAEHSQN